jgi:TfoX/Sxy family transcriptional regulator of competence genes
MAYDQDLALQVHAALGSISGLTEKKMFGGIGYLIHGNMACGVNQKDLIVRVGPERYQAALDHPHTKVFDMTGRPMTGWIVVLPEGYASDADLQNWVQQGVDFALSLPPK